MRQLNLVNNVKNKNNVFGISNDHPLFFVNTGVVRSKLNNVLTERKWIIFDNK